MWWSVFRWILPSPNCLPRVLAFLCFSQSRKKDAERTFGNIFVLQDFCEDFDPREVLLAGCRKDDLFFLLVLVVVVAAIFFLFLCLQLLLHSCTVLVLFNLKFQVSQMSTTDPHVCFFHDSAHRRVNFFPLFAPHTLCLCSIHSLIL